MVHQDSDLTSRVLDKPQPGGQEGQPHGVQKVPINAIKVPLQRLRQPDDTDIDGLAASIQASGMLAPLVVDQSLNLVAGLRRLRAAQRLGMTEVDVAVHAFRSDLARTLVEIDENLVRRELSPLERSEHLHQRKLVYDALHPGARWGGSRVGPPAELEQDPPRGPFLDDAAARFNLGRSTIGEEVRIGAMPQEVRDALRATPVASAKKQLVRLSREPEPVQRRAAELIARGEASGVTTAIALIAREDGEPEESETGKVQERPAADIFDNYAEMADCVNLVASAREALQKLRRSFAEYTAPDVEPIFPVMDSVLELLGAAYGDLAERFLPEADCTYCGEECSSCDKCNGKGWLTRAETQRSRGGGPASSAEA